MSSSDRLDQQNGYLANALIALLGAGLSVACATALIQSFAAALVQSFP